MTSFNPNELVLERIRSVEEYDLNTRELIGRYTQIETPSLTTTAEGTNVTDALGSPIMTFYHAQAGTFSFTNSLFSLDLAASQFGAEKENGSDITMPVSEILPIGANHTVTLSYTPSGEAEKAIKYVKIVTDGNVFGETYTYSATAKAGCFTLDADKKTITLPEDATGKVFVNYEKTGVAVAKVAKSTDKTPAVKSLLIHAIFHDPCDANRVYAGVIYVPRAQIDPSSVELSLTMDGKHAATYTLQKPYCESDSNLFEIMVSEN